MAAGSGFRTAGTVLERAFFERPAPVVAENLMGKSLCRRSEGAIDRLTLNEVEAYDGFEDRASHAHRGRTLRNAVMFGRPGVCYVYLCYGIHWMLNIVTGPQDFPGAVLLRGAGAFSGPGRLTKGLGIDGSMNQRPAIPRSGLWLEDGGIVVGRRDIQRTARVGVDYAGPRWSRRKWRWVWSGGQQT
jgi:DNA-3-methyladenine glycosylase